MKRSGPIIALVVVFAALGFGALAFKSSLTPYLPFRQAISASSSQDTVQIMGAPVKDDTHYDEASKSLSFVLQEKATGAIMPVVFKSPKPDNFDQAVSVGAIGHYDAGKKTFLADNLLVKCPSKYSGDAPAQNRSYASQS